MASAFFSNILVVVRGGGDLASGVIYRLYQAGFPVVVTELARPLLVRRTVSYGEAVYSREIQIEGITAHLATDLSHTKEILASGDIPVMVDESNSAVQTLQPVLVVDGRMAKVNMDTTIADASLVVALGPGFQAGVDCHAIIETNRGHHLGRVIWKGRAEADTGEPGKIAGLSHSRVLRSPAEGYVIPEAEIGDMIQSGQAIARVNDTAIRAPFAGVLRGLIHESVWTMKGMKIGDLDPRASVDYCYSISDKALAVGGGVLEAIFSSSLIREAIIAKHYETSASV